MTVQLDLCWTCSETTLLVFSHQVAHFFVLSSSSANLKHYQNLPMQYIVVVFSAVKIENFIGEILIFLIYLLKTLTELHCQGGSNEYQSMDQE